MSKKKVIAKLKNQKDSGAITQDEFDAKVKAYSRRRKTIALIVIAIIAVLIIVMIATGGMDDFMRGATKAAQEGKAGSGTFTNN
jgi:hypothetical protein